MSELALVCETVEVSARRSPPDVRARLRDPPQEQQRFVDARMNPQACRAGLVGDLPRFALHLDAAIDQTEARLRHPEVVQRERFENAHAPVACVAGSPWMPSSRPPSTTEAPTLSGYFADARRSRIVERSAQTP